jgi:FkbM family methyltransferase
MDRERVQRGWRRYVAAPVLSRLDPVVRTRSGSRTIFVDLRDRIIGRPFFVDRRYEVGLQQLMSHMNLRGGVCVDLGANIGLHTIVMSELVGNRGQVFAFEPEAHNFEILQRNLQANGCDNVRAVMCAVSDKEGSARVRLNDVNFGDHRVTINPTTGQGHSQQVDVTTLDRALSDVPDNAVRFIKIDVQGHEMNVLRGMSQTLRRNRDAILMIEVSPGILPQFGSSASDLMSHLYECGFSGWELQDHRVFPSLPPWTYDLIREQRWAEVIVSRNDEQLLAVMSAYCDRDLSAHASS